MEHRNVCQILHKHDQYQEGIIVHRFIKYMLKEVCLKNMKN